MQDFFVYPVWDRKRTAFRSSFCDPCRIQTCNPHIRSVVLYSVELMDPFFQKRVQRYCFFFNCANIFAKKCDFSTILFIIVYFSLKILARTHIRAARSPYYLFLSGRSAPHREERQDLQRTRRRSKIIIAERPIVSQEAVHEHREPPFLFSFANTARTKLGNCLQGASLVNCARQRLYISIKRGWFLSRTIAPASRQASRHRLR